LPPAKDVTPTAETAKKDSASRQLFRKKFREGKLDDQEIEIEVTSNVDLEIVAPPGMLEMTSQIQNIFQSIAGDRTKRRKMKIKDAFKQLTEEEAAKLINEDDIRSKALD